MGVWESERCQQFAITYLGYCYVCKGCVCGVCVRRVCGGCAYGIGSCYAFAYAVCVPISHRGPQAQLHMGPALRCIYYIICKYIRDIYLSGKNENRFPTILRKILQQKMQLCGC